MTWIDYRLMGLCSGYEPPPNNPPYQPPYGSPDASG
jgi:hypothetical protein